MEDSMNIGELKKKIIQATIGRLQNYSGDNPNTRMVVDNFADEMKDMKELGTTQSYKGMVKSADAKVQLQHKISTNIDNDQATSCEVMGEAISDVRNKP